MQHHSLFRSLLAAASVTGLLLLIPVIAMQLTSEVRWGREDFIAAALLLFGTGVGIVLVTRYTKRTGQRLVLVGLLLLTLALVWAELAVGIFT